MYRKLLPLLLALSFLLPAFAQDRKTMRGAGGVVSQGGSGSLSGSFTSGAATVNLTSEGTVDWKHWGLSQVLSAVNEKTSATAISDLTGVGTATDSDGFGDPSYHSFSWSDGTPTPSFSNSQEGIYRGSLTTTTGMGWTFTVPADGTSRTLRVYCAVYSGTMTFSATLGDGSATAYTNNTSLAVGTDGFSLGFFQIVYSAASSTNLTISITLTTNNNGGNVALSAATLKLS